MAVKLKTGVAARVPLANQGVYYLYRNYKWNAADVSAVSTGVPATIFGVLPANAMPLECWVRINTAFSGSDIQVGTTSALGAVVSTQDLVSGTTGTYMVDRYTGTYTTSDVVLHVTNATSGATAGEADIWLSYLPVMPTT